MGHSVTLGGDRVGSGNKNKIYLHNYERSTHNLSTDFESTMGCGMLIPFMCELVTRDDKYEIDLTAGLRTIPTKGPLFGSFKLQLDVYQCPLRLYQALLHNNPLAIGLKASQVKFPKIRLYGKVSDNAAELTEIMASNNSLVKYLGISGIGTAKGNDNEYTHRDMFGAGVLAYYDIFKNYYANKQEEIAYTLKRDLVSNIDFKTNYVFTSVGVYNSGVDTASIWETIDDENYTTIINPENLDINQKIGTIEHLFYLNKDSYQNEYGDINTETLLDNTVSILYFKSGSPIVYNNTIREHLKNGTIASFTLFEKTNTWNGLQYNMSIVLNTQYDSGTYYETQIYGFSLYEEDTVLEPFNLENIDKMRYDILSFHQLGQSYILDGENNLLAPYLFAIGDSSYVGENKMLWQTPLAGLCVKTYQSDIFNNWLNTEIIDGENGIAAITAIDTSEGAITIDALQFSEKLYNLLNRIAVSGGTYEDYLDAAYTESHKRFNESPIWVGGMSDEIIFEEILQTAPTEGQPLGTIGGRGNLTGKHKGGKITVKIDEPSLLIGIVSITPRIVYTQGNMWFNTEIDSLADIHVPALDAIGFQNLIGEQLHAGSTIINSDGTIEERPIIGKVPAWINYMTNFDRAFGDFAAPDGDGFMVLQRQYEIEDGVIKDATTYIDPAKYNYAFAYTKRDAQNFWVKISCDIKGRRLMSAKQIPTA